MKYYIFKDKTYTGLAYNEINDNIKDFHKNDLIVPLETAPLFKRDKTTGEVLEAFKYSDEEYAALLIELRIVEILEVGLPAFDSKILKCFADGLVFSEKYPEAAAERSALLVELNSIQAK